MPSHQISTSDARLLLLDGLGLLDDRSARASPARTLALIRRLGFVQVDSINIVERAHHHILWSRLHAYRPKILETLQGSGQVFEHWTHDASIIPSELFPHWRHRFARVEWGDWLHRRMGPGHEKLLKDVLDRVRREGPLHARDFKHAGVKGGLWWDWKPAKAALEYWWRTGSLSIAGRGGPGGFEKIYDLTERVLPSQHTMPPLDIDDHTAWACRSALERLGVATAREIAGFWGLIHGPQAAAWCASAVERGEIEPVRAPAPLAGDSEGRATRPPKPAFALHGWRDRLKRARARAGACASGFRVLSPFDPLVRDRARCERLFGFHYRFEAFVPQVKRRHGYYVLPLLEHAEGETRLVGRVDPKLDRAAGVLRVNRVWWERGTHQSTSRREMLERSLEQYARFVGAATVQHAPGARRG